GRLKGRWSHVGHKLLGFDNGIEKLWLSYSPAGLPAGRVERLRRGGTCDRAGFHARQLGYARVLVIVEEKMFVDFIGEHCQVTFNANACKLIQRRSGKYGTRRIMWGVDDD